MKRVEPEFKAGETEIVEVFYEESIFRANEDQQFCRLWNNEQVLKPKSVGRGLMLYELLCLLQGKTVDLDTVKNRRITMKYIDNYGG